MNTPSWFRIGLIALAAGLVSSVALQAQSQLIQYDPMPDAVTSPTFTLTVNGQSVHVERMGDSVNGIVPSGKPPGWVSYARFSFLGTADIQVTLASGTISTSNISPDSYGYNGTKVVSGANLSFSVSQPRMLIVKINSLENLLIFADGPELDAPASSGTGIANVSTYLTSPNPYSGGPTLNYAFSAAITALGGSGGILYVPSANYTYVLSQLTLPANIHLYLESGARLRAFDADSSTTPSFTTAYPAQNNSDSSFIYVTGSNVKISGRGIIDGNGYNLRDFSDIDLYNVKLVRVRGSQATSLTNFTMQDVFLRDSARWTVHLSCTNDVTIKNVKLVNDMTVHGLVGGVQADGRTDRPFVSNTDGFDIDACQNVLIDGCFIYTTDDALTPKVTNNFAVAHPAKQSTNHTLVNNVIYNQKAGLKVGDELRNNMSDIFLGNNDMVVADRFLCLWAANGQDGNYSISSVVALNNRIETVGFPGESRFMFFFKLLPDDSAATYSYPANINGAEVNGLYAKTTGASSSRMWSYDATHTISNIAIKNMYIANVAVDSAADLPFVYKSKTSGVAYHANFTVTTPGTGGVNKETNAGSSSSPYNTASNSSVTADLPVVEIYAADKWAKEGVDTGSFVVSRSGALGSALTVNYTVSGTATSGTDYTAIGSSVVFAIGEQQKTIVVTPAADYVSDDGETVIITLNSSANYAFDAAADPSPRAPTTATVTIANAPPPLSLISVTATDSAASENGDTGTFTVTRTSPTTSALTVYFTLSGTATNGTDYTTIVSSVIIPANASSATVTVTPAIDASTESSETVVLTLDSDAGYVVDTPMTATVNIADVPMVSVTLQDGYATETSPAGTNPGRFRVTRTGSTTAALNVYVTMSGGAGNGSDYTTVSNPVTIPTGASYVFVYIYPITDGLTEGNETVVMTADAGAGYGIDPANPSASFFISSNSL